MAENINKSTKKKLLCMHRCFWATTSNLKFLVVIFVLSVSTLSSCGSSTPNCTDEKTVGLVKNIFYNSIEQTAASWGLNKALVNNMMTTDKISVTMIRTAAHDKTIGKYTCDAVIEAKIPETIEKMASSPFFKASMSQSVGTGSVEIGGGIVKSDIHYTSQLTDDKKQHLVELRGHEPIVDVVVLLSLTGPFMGVSGHQTQAAAPKTPQQQAINVPATSTTVTAQTRYGKIEIKELNQNEKGVIFSSKVIFKRESGYLNIEKIFQIGENDVVLIRNGEGGSGTIDSFFFITIRGVSPPILSKEFMGQTDEISPIQKADQIIIDLGYNQGSSEVLTYKDGVINIKRIKNEGKNKPANEDDCNYLYNNIYVEYVQGQTCGEGPEYVGGMATARAYNSMSNDPRLNLKEFERIAKASCKKHDLIKYSEFKKRVCSYQ